MGRLVVLSVLVVAVAVLIGERFYTLRLVHFLFVHGFKCSTHPMLLVFFLKQECNHLWLKVHVLI